MKKIISLALAAVMTAGMASTSFAKTSDLSKEPYVDGTSPIYVKDKDTGLFVEEKDFSQEYGSEFAVAINHGNVSDKEIGKIMSKYKATFDVKVGAENVTGVKISMLKADNGKRVVAKRTAIAENTYDAGTIEFSKLPGALRRHLYKNNFKKASVHVFYNDGGIFGKAGDQWTSDKEDIYNQYIENFKKGVGYEYDYTNMGSGEYSVGINLFGEKKFIPMDLFDVKDLIELNNDPAVDTNEEIYARNAFEKEMNKLASETVSKTFKKSVKALTKDSYYMDYFVVVGTDPQMLGKDNSDIVGNITISKTGATANSNLDSEPHFKEINFCELINKNLVETEETVEEFDFTMDDAKGVPQLKATFEVNTKGVKNFDGKFEMKTDLRIVDKYPEGWFQFYQWPAKPDFKEKGNLYFYTEDENAKVYAVDENGNLRSIHTKYDHDREAVYISTKGLRSYVVTNVIIKGTNK